MSAVCAASAVMVTRAVAAKTTKSVSLSKASPTRARGRASVATRAVELATGETLEVKPVPMRVGHGFDLRNSKHGTRANHGALGEALLQQADAF